MRSFDPRASAPLPSRGALFLALVPSLLLSVPFAAVALAQAAPDAETLLKSADRSRGGIAEGLTWTVTVDSVEDGVQTDRTYKVRAKDLNAVAQCQAPARLKGETLLFNDRTLWFFKPGLKKPVPISARQRLSGQAANGDIASTNYARDYDGKVVGEDTVDGQKVWKLELQAKNKNVTYDKIRYWIDKTKLVGVKAEFLTLKGDVFKGATFEYGNTLKNVGKTFPFVSKMTITDAVTTGNKTTITYSSPAPEAHADSVFNVNNLAR